MFTGGGKTNWSYDGQASRPRFSGNRIHIHLCIAYCATICGVFGVWPGSGHMRLGIFRSPSNYLRQSVGEWVRESFIIAIASPSFASLFLLQRINFHQLFPSHSPSEYSQLCHYVDSHPKCPNVEVLKNFFKVSKNSAILNQVKYSRT